MAGSACSEHNKAVTSEGGESSKNHHGHTHSQAVESL